MFSCLNFYLFCSNAGIPTSPPHYQPLTPPPPVKAPPTAPPTATPFVEPPKIATPPVIGKDYTEPIKGIRKAMVKTMTAAQKIPPFGYYDEIDVTALVKFRNDVKEQTLARGVKFSYMPVFIKVSDYKSFVNYLCPETKLLTTYFMVRLMSVCIFNLTNSLRYI